MISSLAELPEGGEASQLSRTAAWSSCKLLHCRARNNNRLRTLRCGKSEYAAATDRKQAA